MITLDRTNKITSTGKLLIEHECKNCGNRWSSTTENPKVCRKCGTLSWREGKIEETYTPIPRFDHSEKKEIKELFSKCPYCRGTTGSNSTHHVIFCYSCDMTWSFSTKQPLGVIKGIGLLH